MNVSPDSPATFGIRRRATELLLHGKSEDEVRSIIYQELPAGLKSETDEVLDTAKWWVNPGIYKGKQ